MTFDVDVEVVLPLPGARGPRLQARHVDAVRRERRDQLVQGAGSVVRGHDERGAVFAGGAGVVRSEHQETGPVLGIVLDRAREQLETVARGCDLGTDRRRRRLLRRDARGFGVARERNALGARQVLREPAVTLREGLRVRIDLAYRLDRRPFRHQVLLHAQHHFGADLQGRREQQVERASDRAVGGVFHGDDRVLRGPRLGGAEHLVDRSAGLRRYARAELLGERHLAESALRPKVGDRERLLERAAGGDDLGEKPRERIVRERPAVGVRDPAQNLGLALGAVGAAVRLQLADGGSARRALVQERGDLLVERVDRGAVLGDVVGHSRIINYRSARRASGLRLPGTVVICVSQGTRRAGGPFLRFRSGVIWSTRWQRYANRRHHGEYVTFGKNVNEE